MSHLHDVWKDGCFIYQVTGDHREINIAAVSSTDAAQTFKEVTGEDALGIVYCGELDAVSAWAKVQADITS